MKRLLFLIVLIAGTASYLYYVRGWTWRTLEEQTVDKIAALVGLAPETRPIGGRGVGTHWETAEPLLTPRAESGAAAAAGKIYVVGGFDGYGRTLDSVEAYDVDKDQWRNVLHMPQALHHPAVASDDKKIYVAGGWVGIGFQPVDQAYMYDTTVREWTELGHLGDFRGGAAAAVASGRLLVVGGRTTAGPSGELEEYNFGNGAWATRTPMPTPRERLAAAALDGKLYAVGGRQNDSSDLNTVEAYDPATNKWKTLAPMPSKRSEAAAAAVDGKLYVFGGEGPNGPFETVDVYDPKTDAWKTIPLVMPTPRHGLAAAVWQNRAYLIGGGSRKGYSVSDKNEILFIEAPTSASPKK